MTRFLLIRHATTELVGKRLAGRMPGVHLSREGKQQASSLAEQLSALPITAIYSSPLERAVETAAAIAEKLQLKPVIADAFTELDYGEWTNEEIAELESHPAFQRWNRFRSTAAIPGGETMAEAQSRFLKGMHDLVQQHTGQTIAIVTHSDLIKSVVAHFTGMPIDLTQRLEISPASVSIIEVYDETATILLVNGFTYLRF